MQLSDGEIRDGDKTNGDDGSEEEKQYQILDPTVNFFWTQIYHITIFISNKRN